MTDEQCKSIMAAIVFTDIDKESFIESGECAMEAASSIAEDLFAHVLGLSVHEEDNDVDTNAPIKH